MGTWIRVVCVLGLLAATGCSKDKDSKATGNTTTGTGNTTTTDKAAPPSNAPPEKSLACKTMADCVVTCTGPPVCCGQGCRCTHVYNLADLEAYKKYAARICATKKIECKQYRCPKPIRKLVADCRAGKCVGVEMPADGRYDNGFFMRADAPPPQACKVDSDCIGDTVPDWSGCCQDHRIKPHSKAYKQWYQKMRKDSCQGVTCPPPPPPAQPARCAITVKCVKGTCANTCPPKK
jgi:hypothetical protein